MGTENFEIINPYDYKGFRVHRGACKLQINYKLHIVIATELQDNYGTSITDYVDYLARQVCHDFALNPAKIIWIEHWYRRGKHSYDLVTFKCENGKLHSPVWQPLTQEEFEQYILQADA